jgi:hypothetical protein
MVAGVFIGSAIGSTSMGLSGGSGTGTEGCRSGVSGFLSRHIVSFALGERPPASSAHEYDDADASRWISRSRTLEIAPSPEKQAAARSLPQTRNPIYQGLSDLNGVACVFIAQRA